MTIKVGDRLPEGALTMMDGTRAPLHARDGRALMVYFYPKDDTSGCTREAQEFSELRGEFDALGVDMMGVSKDTPAKHAKFVAKHDLKIPLATDEDGAVIEAFGSWIEKSMYGRIYMGIDQSTFLFGHDGTLVREWRKVRVAGHADAVLEAARALDSTRSADAH